MRILKLFLLVALAFGTFFSIHNEALAKVDFKDLKTTHPQYNEIQYLVEIGVIEGVTMKDGRYFVPERSVTRAEVAKMIVVAAGYQPKSVEKSSFTDVPMNVMTGYIEKAVELGFMSPTSAGKFSPNVPIKRDEMSKVLAIAFKLDVDATKQLSIPFKDVASTNKYYPYISALYYNGITDGVSPDHYGLNNEVRRDIFSTFVARTKSSNFALAKPAIGVPAPDESQAVARVYSTVDNLNVRTGPSTTASSIGKINTGDKLSAFEVEGSWVKVAFSGYTGYVSKSYIKFIDTNGMTFQLSNAHQMKLQHDATVYRGTDTSTKQITKLSKGTTVETYGVKGNWTIVVVKGIPGYVDSNAFAVESPESSKPIEQITDTVGKVTVSSLNIRKAATTNSDIVGKVSEGDIVHVHSISGWWANVSYNGVNGYVHKTYLHLMNTNSSPVKNRIIVIDPGHGGTDVGAANGSTYEKNIVLDVSKRLKALLVNAGAKVVLTRSTDVFITLNERPNIASRNYGEMFISVHTNSFPTPDPLGTETFYNSSSNTNLSEEISLAKNINNEIVKNANMYNRGVKYGNYAVTRPLEMPAILVELGFLSNPNDFEKLTNEEYLQIFAQSIFNGIEQYYQYN